MRGTWKTTDSGGGGGLVLVVIIAALAIGSGAASAAVSAVVTIVLIVTGCVTGLAVLGAVAWLVHRARQDRSGRPVAAWPMVQAPPSGRRELSDPYKAIEPPRDLHVHFHGLTAEQVAAIITQRGGS